MKKYQIILKKIGDECGVVVQRAPSIALAMKLVWQVLPKPLAGYYYQIIEA